MAFHGHGHARCDSECERMEFRGVSIGKIKNSRRGQATKLHCKVSQVTPIRNVLEPLDLRLSHFGVLAVVNARRYARDTVCEIAPAESGCTSLVELRSALLRSSMQVGHYITPCVHDLIRSRDLTMLMHAI